MLLDFGSSTVTSKYNAKQCFEQVSDTVCGRRVRAAVKIVINDPVVNGVGNGGMTVQNNAILVLNNANNTYGGVTTVTGSGGVPGNTANLMLLVNGICKLGTGRERQ